MNTDMSGNNIEQILTERGKTHGDFTHQAALSIHLKHRWGMALTKAHSGPDQQPGLPPFANHQYIYEGVDMIMHKLARTACGDPLVEDHWRDIAGYATLVADRVRQFHQQQAQKQKEEAQHVRRDTEQQRDTQPAPDGGGSATDRRDSGQTSGPGPSPEPNPLNLGQFARELADLGFCIILTGAQ